MSYISNNLMNGENLLYSAKLHWVIFLWPAVWFIVAIIFFCGGSNYAIAGGILIFVALLTGIVAFVNYSTSEFGITTKRVIVKVGLIRRISIEVLLNKVEGIQVNQGILGRILGYGSITVSGTGGTKDPFHKISDPLAFRRKAQEQISAAQESK
jgi:uncharacterized membrane protein YdbT with pleckstrin-like domain